MKIMIRAIFITTTTKIQFPQQKFQRLKWSKKDKEVKRANQKGKMSQPNKALKF
jgi:hypothetical protein